MCPNGWSNTHEKAKKNVQKNASEAMISIFFLCLEIKQGETNNTYLLYVLFTSSYFLL